MGRLITWVFGNLEGGGFGEGLRKGRSVYKQPETRVDGSCHDQEGFQVSRRDQKGEQRGNQQGEIKKQGDCAMYIVIRICVHKCCVDVDNNLNCV